MLHCINKPVLLQFLRRTLLILSLTSGGFNVQAQTGSGFWVQQSGAVMCDGNSSLVAGYQFDFHLQGNQTAKLDLLTYDPMNPNISTVVASGVMTITPSNGSSIFNVNVNLTWTANSVSIRNITSNSSPSSSVSFPIGNFPEGLYGMRARVFTGTNPGPTITHIGHFFQFQKGYRPSNVQINGNSDPQVTLLEGCVNNEVLLTSSPLCGDVYHLFVRKIDPKTGSVIGPEASRWLSANELNNLSGNGLNIKSFTGNGHTVVMNADSTYQVGLTNNAYGGWKSVARWVQMKAGDWDLVMHDNNTKDNGFEPWDQWDYDLFESPDLWNKKSNALNVNDGIHDAPDFVSQSGNTNKILVEVTNIGCAQSPVNVPLRLFWTRARVGEYWDSHWLYDTTNNAVISSIPGFGNYAAGSEITIVDPTTYSTNSAPYLLPEIGPGLTWTMSYANGVEWFPPNPDHYDASNGGMTNTRPQLCLLARINEPGSTDDPISWEPTGTTDHIAPYVRNNNNVVTRNTVLYNDLTFIANPGNGSWNYGFTTVLVDNTSETSQTLNLCIDKVLENDGSGTDFLEFGSIEIGMSEGLFDLWQAGGQETLNMEISEETLFEVTEGAHACVNGITLEPGASEILGVRFNFSGEVFPEEDIPLRFDINPDYYEEGVQGSANIIQLIVPAESPLEQSEPEQSIYDSEEVENNFAASIQMFPNPAKQVLNVYYSLDQEKIAGVFDLKIVNMSGQIMLSKKSLKMNTMSSINIEDLKAGIYLVEFQTDDQIITERLIIE